MEKAGNLQAVGPDDRALRRVGGVKGLLLEDVGDRTEEHIYTVNMASIKHAAKLAADSDKKSLHLVPVAVHFALWRCGFSRWHRLSSVRC